MKQIIKKVTTTTDETATYVLNQADVVSGEVKKKIESNVAPIRGAVLKRYPILFSLLTVFGVATTYYAFEKILGQYEVLNDNPWLILALGIAILTFTGTIYKKMNAV